MLPPHKLGFTIQTKVWIVCVGLLANASGLCRPFSTPSAPLVALAAAGDGSCCAPAPDAARNGFRLAATGIVTLRCCGGCCDCCTVGIPVPAGEGCCMGDEAATPGCMVGVPG